MSMLFLWLAIARAAPLDAHELPDPGAAAVLSASVGFGAGHFYARNPGVGTPLLFGQGIAAGMMLASGAMPPTARRDPNPGLALAGAGLFLVTRAIDVIAAPYSARRAAREEIRRSHAGKAGVHAHLVLTRAQLELGISVTSEDRERTLDALERLLSRGAHVESILAAMRNAHVAGDRSLYQVLARAYSL